MESIQHFSEALRRYFSRQVEPAVQHYARCQMQEAISVTKNIGIDSHRPDTRRSRVRDCVDIRFQIKIGGAGRWAGALAEWRQWLFGDKKRAVESGWLIKLKS